MGVKVREKVKGSGEWWVFVNHQGKRTSKKVGSKGAAHQVKVELEAQLASGTFEVRNVPTFNKLFNEFIPNKPIREQTKATYISIFETHLKHTLGPKPVDEITYEDLSKLPFGNLSKAHRNNIFTIVSMVMNEAIRRQYIVRSPTQNGARTQIAGKVESDNGNHPFETGQEVETFLKGTRQHCPEVYYYLFLTMAGCGLRPGESVALDWSMIDFANDVIRVRYNWVFAAKKKGKPKTPASRRDVTMPAVVANELEIWHQKAESDIVFPNKNGDRISKSALDQMLKKVCRKLKIQSRSAKDLRATYGTLRASKNHSLQDIQKQMGHENISTTIKHYSKYLPTSHKVQVDEFGEMILPAPKRTLSAPNPSLLRG